MGRQSGYTVIEVLLFIAISGLLVMAVLNGFSGAINNNRKTDASRSFESAIETIYSGVRSAEAFRPIDTNGKAVCIAQEAFPRASNESLVIGKLLWFQNVSTVKVYNVVSNVDPDTNCDTALTGVEVLSCYNPRVIDMSNDVDLIVPQWQAQIAQVTFQNIGNSTYLTGVNLLAFLRHPESELVYVVPIRNTSVSGTGAYTFTASNFSNNYANTKGQICLKHDAYPVPKTYTLFNGGEGVGSIDMSDSPLTGAPVCS